MYVVFACVVLVFVLVIIAIAGFAWCGNNRRSCSPRNNRKCCLPTRPKCCPPKCCVGFGNTIRVDAVYGDDLTGAINGCPFKTIGAALLAAGNVDQNVVPCFEVWIFPGEYQESELVIPAGVSVIGLDASDSQPPLQSQIQSMMLGALLLYKKGQPIPPQAIPAPKALVSTRTGLMANGVVIRYTSTTPSPSTGVFMSNGSSLKNVVIWLDGTSSSADLTAVNISNDAAGRSNLSNVICFVDAGQQPASPTSKASCVTVSGVNTIFNLSPSITDCLMAVFSNSFGNIRARAVYHSAPGYFIVNNSFLFAIAFGNATNEIAGEAAASGSILDLQGCTVAATFAEVSQVDGATVYMNSTTPFGFARNGTANQKSFETKLYSSMQVWGISNDGAEDGFPIGAASYSFMPVGTIFAIITNMPNPIVYQITREHVVAYKLSLVVKTFDNSIGTLVASVYTVDPDGTTHKTNLVTGNLVVLANNNFQSVTSANLSVDLFAGQLIAVRVDNIDPVNEMSFTSISVSVQFY